MKKICFPTDFSELSKKAFATALKLSELMQAELHIVHVMKLDFSIKVDNDSLTDVFQQGAQSQYEKLKETVSDTFDQSKLHFTSLRGNASEKINHYCHHNSIDLLVMSTHGYSGLKRMFMGSVTNKLLRSTEIPVFTLNPKSLDGFDLNGVKNILYPTDLTDTTHEQGLEFSANLAQNLKASLTLVHVLNDYKEWLGIYGDAYGVVGNYGSFQGYLKEQKADAEKKLEQLKNRIKDKFPDIEVSCVFTEGAADKAILDQCRFNYESIIVMSTHGYSGLERLVMGSITERVIQSSIEPVIAFNLARQEESDDETKEERDRHAAI